MQARKIQINLNNSHVKVEHNVGYYTDPLAKLTLDEKRWLWLLLQQKNTFIEKNEIHEVVDSETGEKVSLTININLFIYKRGKAPNFGYAILDDVKWDEIDEGGHGKILRLNGLINPEIDGELTYVNKSYLAKLTQEFIDREIIISRLVKKTKMKQGTEIAGNQIDKHKKYLEPNEQYSLSLIREIPTMNFHEYVEGIRNGDLKVSDERKLDITIKILSALQALHNRGILHRDIKHENIMIGYNNITHNYEIVIIDFGASILIKNNRFSFVGTPFYVAPEVHENFALPPDQRVPANELSDGWSIAMVLAEFWGAPAPLAFVKRVGVNDPTKADLARMLIAAKKPKWYLLIPENELQVDIHGVLQAMAETEMTDRLSPSKGLQKCEEIRLNVFKKNNTYKLTEDILKKVYAIALQAKMDLGQELKKYIDTSKKNFDGMLAIIQIAYDQVVAMNIPNALYLFVDVLDINTLRALPDPRKIGDLIEQTYNTYTANCAALDEYYALINKLYPSGAQSTELQKLIDIVKREKQSNKLCQVEFDEFYERTSDLKRKLIGMDGKLEAAMLQEEMTILKNLLLALSSQRFTDNIFFKFNKYVMGSIERIKSIVINKERKIDHSSLAFEIFVNELDVPVFKTLHNFNEIKDLIDNTYDNFVLMIPVFSKASVTHANINDAILTAVQQFKILNLVASDVKPQGQLFDAIYKCTQQFADDDMEVDNAFTMHFLDHEREINLDQFEKNRQLDCTDTNISILEKSVMAYILHLQGIMNGATSINIEYLFDKVGMQKVRDMQTLDKINTYAADQFACYKKLHKEYTHLARSFGANCPREVARLMEEFKLELKHLPLVFDNLSLVNMILKDKINKLEYCQFSYCLDLLGNAKCSAEMFKKEIESRLSQRDDKIVYIDSLFAEFITTKQNKKQTSVFFNHDLNGLEKEKMKILKNYYYSNVQKELLSKNVSLEVKQSLVAHAHKNHNIINYNVNYLFCQTNTRDELDRLATYLRVQPNKG